MKTVKFHGFIPLWSYGESIRAYRMKSIRPERMYVYFKMHVCVFLRFCHPNLIPMTGYSVDGPELCFVFEYMSYGSLADNLYSRVCFFYFIFSRLPLWLRAQVLKLLGSILS